MYSVVAFINSKEENIKEWPILTRIRDLADSFFGSVKNKNRSKKIKTPSYVGLKIHDPVANCPKKC